MYCKKSDVYSERTDLSMENTNWIIAKIFTTTEGIEPVCGCLLGVGITGFEIKDSKDFEEFLERKDGNWDYIDDDLMEMRTCESCVTVYIADNEQGKEMLNALNREMISLKERDVDNKFGRLETELSGIKEEDWANNWKQYFKPFEVGTRLAVKPSWESYKNPNGRTILEIDPASSFGTGQHNTTRLCLELIEKTVKNGDKILDLGCGSGILSIAGILLGAENATAVDIDQNSVKIAKENFAKNNIPDSNFNAYVGNIIGDDELREKLGGGYDLVVANIVADVLIAMSPIFGRFMKADGKIIISGIIIERCDEVMTAMEKNGFRRVELRENGGWAAAEFEKNI